jgi:hypothetical protein
LPVEPGVKLYHTVRPTGAPPHSGGSSISTSAPVVTFVSSYGSGKLTVAAFANRSFDGTTAEAMFSVRFPGSVSTLPACMR